MATTNTALIKGNTFPHKEELKLLGGRWDAAEKGWRVPADKAEEARALVGGAEKPAAASDHSATISVGGLEIEVELFAGARRLPRAKWPMTAAAIERLARETFTAAGGRADRADVVWAINKAGLGIGADHMFRAVPTAAEARDMRRAGRDEAADGLCRPRRARRAR